MLDPANNAIKYKDTGASATCASNLMLNNMTYSQAVDSIKTQIETRSPQNFAMNFEGVESVTCAEGRVTITVKRSWCTSGCAPGVVYTYGGGLGDAVYTFGITGNNDDIYKTIPISTVADKIYDNAKTDSASASIVNDAVKDYVNEGSADVALDAAKADADATHACGTGTSWNGSACVADTPGTPDTPFDPTDIIDAIGKVFDAVMSLPDVINSALDDLLVDIKDFFQPVIDSFTDFVDWVKQEPTPENPTQPDVTTLPTPQTDSVNISFDGGCPAPNVIPWSLAGQNVDMTISYTPICDTATLLNPIIKLAASLGAVFIIAGIRRGDDG